MRSAAVVRVHLVKERPVLVEWLASLLVRRAHHDFRVDALCLCDCPRTRALTRVLVIPHFVEIRIQNVKIARARGKSSVSSVALSQLLSGESDGLESESSDLSASLVRVVGRSVVRDDTVTARASHERFDLFLEVLAHMP